MHLKLGVSDSEKAWKGILHQQFLDLIIFGKIRLHIISGLLIYIQTHSIAYQK